MTGARTNALTILRERIERIETPGVSAPGRIALGHGEADAALQGGLARGALHEVFAEGGRHGAAATGFVAALISRVNARRPLVWVRPATRSVPSCWRSGARRGSSISSPAAS
jgi:protein ImuA